MVILFALPHTDVAKSENKSEAKGSLEHYWSVTAVPEVSVALFCLKFVRYSMFLWLPMYLIDHLGYSKVQAGLLSTVYDIGGILGSPCLGIYLDRVYPQKPLFGIYQVFITF